MEDGALSPKRGDACSWHIMLINSRALNPSILTRVRVEAKMSEIWVLRSETCN